MEKITRTVRAMNPDGTPWSSEKVLDWLKAEGKPVLLAMSRGKDSLAAWCALKDWDIPCQPFFMAPLQDLSFVDESIKELEEWSGQHILVYPHGMDYHFLRHGLFQSPGMRQMTMHWKLPDYDAEDVAKIACEDMGWNPKQTWTITGVRAADSVVRLAAMKKHGPITLKRRTVHAVWDWRKARMVEVLERHKVPLPKDYLMFGRSLDGCDYRFIEPIRNMFPEDYEKIKEWMPLIDVEWRRYKLRGHPELWRTDSGD